MRVALLKPKPVLINVQLTGRRRLTKTPQTPFAVHQEGHSRIRRRCPPSALHSFPLVVPTKPGPRA
ncbi:hypothetical protein LX32DRAFT_640664 [Colletotrichum zoysiae]|uniref:Uncharacterized protein n=1 Tax=Colletotrichum zoysiae TaxID=1216348 RepID=A0AAD9HGG3_9PEZI|nr:hypothetical protein LX32DRAFT_640664 [Colletotrichum zoysiae]